MSRSVRRAILLGAAVLSGFLAPFGFAITRAIAAEKQLTLQPGEVVSRVTTAASPDQQYSLYLPSSFTTGRTWPLLIVMDPRGRAMLGLDLFREGAERHGYIVMSSYQTRSDTAWSVTTAALKALLQESEARFPVDHSRIYLAGLSGTSRAAWGYANALTDTVAGVVGVAGARPQTLDIPKNGASFDYFGVTGTTDFNHREMVELSLDLEGTETAHRLEIFDGGHSWPPAAISNAAIDWFELQRMRRRETPADEGFIDQQLGLALGRFESAIEILERVRRCREIERDFRELREVKEVSQQCDELAKSRAYKGAIANRKRLFDQEATYIHRRLAPWLVEFRQPEKTPPTVKRSLIDLQIRALQKRARATDDLQSAYSAQRLLDDVYANVSFYLPRDMEQDGNLDRAALSLQIAIEVLPERRRAYWRLAEIYAGADRTDKAFESLHRAIGLGSVDYERLVTDPAWESLRRDPAWQTILEAAKAQTQ